MLSFLWLLNFSLHLPPLVFKVVFILFSFYLLKGCSRPGAQSLRINALCSGITSSNMWGVSHLWCWRIKVNCMLALLFLQPHSFFLENLVCLVTWPPTSSPASFLSHPPSLRSHFLPVICLRNSFKSTADTLLCALETHCYGIIRIFIKLFAIYSSCVWFI